MKFLIASILFLGIPLKVFAISAIAMKGHRVLLDCGSEKVNVGDFYAAIDERGEEKALLQIKQLKNERAIARVIDGEFTMDYLLEKSVQHDHLKSSPFSINKQTHAEGLFLGSSSNIMAVKTISGTILMSGASWGLSGFYQMNISKAISAQIMGSYESLAVKSTSSSCSGTCLVDLGYLGLESLIRYKFFDQKDMASSIGFGLGFLLPISKSSNIIETGEISINQTFLLSFGLDWKLNNNLYIPLQIDYARFPDTSASSASQLFFRAGYGLKF